MSKLLKKHITEDLKRRLEKLEGYVLVDFRGLNSAQSYDLRRTLNGVGIRMSVVPNRLAVRILDRWQGKRAEFREFFRGPTALVYGPDGAISASKTVAQWKKKNKDLLHIKGGVLNGELVRPSEVESLARIPDRKQLLAQLAGTVQAPVARLASATQGIVRQLVYVLDAHRRKLEEAAPPPTSEAAPPTSEASPPTSEAAPPEPAPDAGPGAAAAGETTKTEG
jgi:large subunit ribosomal protein L10